VVGTLLLAAGVGFISLGIVQGSAWGWASARTLGVAAAGLLLLAWALRRSARQAAPAVETQLWRIRTFALANVVSLFYGAALYAWLLEGVLFLVNVWHYSVLDAGLAMSPGAVLSAAVAVLAGRIGARRDPRLLVVVGATSIVVSGVWLVLALTARPDFAALFLPAGLLAGFGMGALSTAVSTAAALSVQPPRFAGATGLNMAARQVGGALGIAALAAILPAVPTDLPPAYLHVLIFCCITAALAGVAGTGLSLKRAPGAPVPAEAPSVPMDR
jgi:MFS family permease